MDTQAGTAIELPSQATLAIVAHSSQSPAPTVTQAASSRDITPGRALEIPSRTTRKPTSHSPPAQIDPATSKSDMQPPPPKRQRIHNYDRRPRLSICPSVSPDPDLVQDRDRNDNTLKGKFEAIFEKYGRDFSEIGDEINVITGEVIVDHGHILSMQDEKDPGSPSRARPRVSRDPTEVRSIDPTSRGERSITVGALDIIASIEAMARRVRTGQTPYADEDDEEEKEEEEEADDVYESGEDVVPYRSGSFSTDSLLGSGGDDHHDNWESQGSGSPDSFFGREEQDSSIDSFYDEHAILPPPPLSPPGSRYEPIMLTSGPIPTPVADLGVLTARMAGSHGHPVPASFRAPSPPVFVKSNGKRKVVLGKINVSKEYELQRQVSLTPAITLSQPDTSQAAISKAKSSRPSARPQLSPRKAEPAGKLQEVASKPTAIRDNRTILKRLPVARPSSEPLTMEGDYESDDPLQ